MWIDEICNWTPIWSSLHGICVLHSLVNLTIIHDTSDGHRIRKRCYLVTSTGKCYYAFGVHVMTNSLFVK